MIFINIGDGEFEEIDSGAIFSSNTCSFGSSFSDYDNDGDLDLLVTSGFCNTSLKNNLYENQGEGYFVKVSNLLADDVAICSFGAAWGDVNKDGFQDLLIANCRNHNSTFKKKNTLLINLGNENNWINVKLKGKISNSDAIGARVRLKAMMNGKEVQQVREVRSQTGYAGQNSLNVHFGLLDADLIDSLIIFWPSGEQEILRNRVR